MTLKKQVTLLGASIIGLLVLIYHSALRIPYFGDDFQWVFPHPSGMIFGNFLHRAPDNDWYRPLQSTILASIQLVWGMDTLPIRIVHLLIHSAMAVFIFRVLRYWGVRVWTAIAIAIYFAVSQASVYPVTANDMVSQMMGAMFGALAIWNLYRGMDSVSVNNQLSPKRLVASLLCFACALFSKETSTGLCIAVFALFWLMDRNINFVSKSLSVGKRIIPFVLVALLYLILRIHAGATMPDYGANGVYQMHFGLNIIKNIGLFAFEAVLPFSSAQTMQSVFTHNYFELVIIIALSGIIGFVWFYALLKSQNRTLGLFLLLFALFSVVPAVFLNHVSESYLYNALPYLMISFGFALEFYWLSKRRATIIVISALLVIAMVLNADACIRKSEAIAILSDRAQILMPQLYPIISNLPPNSRLYLVNPSANEFEYSQFAMKGFGPVKYADPWFRHVTHRTDVQIFVLDSIEFCDSISRNPGIAYTLRMSNLIQPY